MANRLTMADIHAIQRLHESDYSDQEIAALLHVDRSTVAKYVAAGAHGPSASAEAAEGTACDATRPPPDGQNPPNAPSGYVGRRLWVRWDSRLVRIFNDRWEQLAVHAKAEPGRFRTAPEHIPQRKVSAVVRGTDALLRQVAAIGQHVQRWAEAMAQARGVEGVRMLVGLKARAAKHGAQALERACETALTYGAWRLRKIRQLLDKDAAKQTPFEFLDEHPVIRPRSDYSLDSLLQFRKDRRHESDPG